MEGTRPSRRRTVPSPPRDPPSIPASTPSRRRPSLPADPWEPVLTYVSPSPSRPALALAGPAGRARESGHPGNAPAGLTAGSGRGRETGFAPPRIPGLALAHQTLTHALPKVHQLDETRSQADRSGGARQPQHKTSENREAHQAEREAAGGEPGH
jgi:hypothetical protein